MLVENENKIEKKIQIGRDPPPKIVKSDILYRLNFVWNILIWFLVENNKKIGIFHKAGSGVGPSSPP